MSLLEPAQMSAESCTHQCAEESSAPSRRGTNVCVNKEWIGTNYRLRLCISKYLCNQSEVTDD